MDTYNKLEFEYSELKNKPIQTSDQKMQIDTICKVIEDKLILLDAAVQKNNQKSIQELSITIRLLIEGLKTINV